MKRMINVTLNGRVLAVEEGSTILEAATKNHVHIPTLCHHPLLRKVGTCRVCLVETKTGTFTQAPTKLVPSCVTQAVNGMIIETQVRAQTPEFYVCFVCLFVCYLFVLFCCLFCLF